MPNESSSPSGAPARRANGRKRFDGEGSIAAHKTGGNRGRLMVGYRPDGNPDVRQVYGTTQDECRRKLDELRQRHARGELGTPQAERETVGAFLQSRRDVPLGEDATAALRAHLARQREERLARGLGRPPADRDLVFATRRGTPLDRGVVQMQFKNALRRAGLRPERVRAIRFHDLRHFAATTMLYGGEPLPTVAKILGHRKHSTTLDIYSHAVAERVRAATTAIERAVRVARAAPTPGAGG